MKFAIFSNYRTTIIGLAATVVGLIAASGHTSIMDALMDFKIQMAALMAFLGILSKDANVSGNATSTTQTGPVGAPLDVIAPKEKQ